MISPAVRLADAAARGPYDGYLPAPGSQPIARVDGPATPLRRAERLSPAWPLDRKVGALLDLSLAAVPGWTRPRRVPSAGALYPVDAHVFAGGIGHLYDPIRHRLIRQPDRPDRPGPDGVLVVLSLAPERTRWKYGSRSLPSLLLDLGHAVGALAAAAAVVDLECWIQGDADTGPLSALTGRPHSLVALHLAEPAAGPPAWELGGDRPRPIAESGDLVTDALIELGSGSPEPTWFRTGLPRFTDDVLRDRRSADPPFTGSLRSADLDALLAGTPLLAATAEGLRDAQGPVASGDARPVLAAWAAGQGFVADAAAVLLYAAPLDDYRQEHVRAGLAVHRALLGAQARGLRARAIGSWGQADLGAALGRRPGTSLVVHGAVVGPATATPTGEDTYA
ncbi:hypothetical protein ACFXJ8_38800 [Nonomuraea sp. NPDC059194]|uniref:hypothetical protein n=1 Tax=Nonomuraea sp. NPDC059194 TaxID=3346764 RepID=UPI0036CA4F93